MSCSSSSCLNYPSSHNSPKPSFGSQVQSIFLLESPFLLHRISLSFVIADILRRATRRCLGRHYRGSRHRTTWTSFDLKFPSISLPNLAYKLSPWNALKYPIEASSSGRCSCPEKRFFSRFLNSMQLLLC